MKIRDYEAGRRVNLTARTRVTLGEMVNFTHHPSGRRFDGPAVIVAAYLTNGNAIARVVSLSDPALRECVLVLEYRDAIGPALPANCPNCRGRKGWETDAGFVDCRQC